MAKPNIKIVQGKKGADYLEVYGPLVINKTTQEKQRAHLATFYGRNAMTHALMFADVIREKYNVPEILTVDPRTPE